MQVSKVDRQVVVTMPSGAVVSEVVRDFLLSLWTCEEWGGNISATFAPVLAEGSKLDNETKYTATRSMDRNAEYKQLDNDHILSVNVLKLPSGDLLLILSEHDQYPHDLEVVEYNGCVLSEVIEYKGNIKWSITSSEGYTLKDNAYTLEYAKRRADLELEFDRWCD